MSKAYNLSTEIYSKTDSDQIFVICFLVVTASEKCSECKENFLARKLASRFFIFQGPHSSFSSGGPRESSVLEAEEGCGGPRAYLRSFKWIHCKLLQEWYDEHIWCSKSIPGMPTIPCPSVYINSSALFCSNWIAGGSIG